MKRKEIFVWNRKEYDTESPCWRPDRSFILLMTILAISTRLWRGQRLFGIGQCEWRAARETVHVVATKNVLRILGDSCRHVWPDVHFFPQIFFCIVILSHKHESELPSHSSRRLGRATCEYSNSPCYVPRSRKRAVTLSLWSAVTPVYRHGRDD